MNKKDIARPCIVCRTMFTTRQVGSTRKTCSDKCWNKKKGDHRNKKTDDERAIIISKIKTVFKQDGTISEACAYAGISIMTYHEWVKNNKVLAYEFEQAKEQIFIVARNAMYIGLTDKKLDKMEKAKFALNVLRKRDKRYSDKQETEHSGGVQTGSAKDWLSDMKSTKKGKKSK